MSTSPALRLRHLGCAGLLLQLPGGRCIAVDPPSDPGPEASLVLSWNEAERLEGTAVALRSGRSPELLARPELLDWAAHRGAVNASRFPAELCGLRIEAQSYRPIPYATAYEAMLKSRSGLLDPLRAARRLVARARLPSSPPQVLRFTLPDGRRLLHLNCSLHRWTPQDWLEQLAADWGGAELVLASWDTDQADEFMARIGHFAPGRLIVADLVNDVRRELDLPVQSYTPTADRLQAQGLSTLVLASGTALRFEGDH